MIRNEVSRILLSSVPNNDGSHRSICIIGYDTSSDKFLFVDEESGQVRIDNTNLKLKRPTFEIVNLYEYGAVLFFVSDYIRWFA